MLRKVTLRENAGLLRHRLLPVLQANLVQGVLMSADSSLATKGHSPHCDKGEST